MKKNVLFVTTVYKTGEKMYPILPKLLEKYDIDVLNISQMSEYTKWDGDVNLKNKFYSLCESLNIKMISGPGISGNKEKNKKLYNEFMGDIGSVLKKSYNIVILDNNVTQKGMSLSTLYKWAKEEGSIVFGSPHGNKEYKAYRAVKRMGRLYDYSFIFGEKEKRNLIEIEKESKRPGARKYLLPAGLPSNDILTKYNKGNKYILIITGFTEAPPKGGITKGIKPFNKSVFNELDILGLSQEYNCEIVVKEKNHFLYKPSSFRESMKGYKDMRFVLDCVDDNKLIADAKIVISAPSTLTFKSIQIGIPTVVLRGYGALGNFYDFPGLIDLSSKDLRASIKRQLDTGRDESFIKDTLEGGLKFNSIDMYVGNIVNVAG